ncbi:E3 ubiquitin-protein ligase TRIM39-like isoform X1 [Ambystoma mexicanum]|uniref:E3 ubiquitin-protein ligase TRIM39-like isoform X1 n=1 Tax=Ambystoma mexicanum TaxID=8296 RepID=UPI0037E7F5F5
MAAAHPERNLQEEITCPICLDYFKDPTTTNCGHSFCRACIVGYWEALGANPTCPQCREPCERGKLKDNAHLASILEKVRQLQGSRPQGGHLCRQHGEKVKLFCKNDLEAICVLCDRSIQHRYHFVLPIKEAAQEYKKSFQESLVPLNMKLQDVKLFIFEENQEAAKLEELCKDQRKSIVCEFENFQRHLEDMKLCFVSSHDLEEQDILMSIREGAIQKGSRYAKCQNLLKEIKKIYDEPGVVFLKDTFRNQRENIVLQFEDLQRFVEEKKFWILAGYDEEEKDILKRDQGRVIQLKSQHSSLQKLITEVEDKCQQIDMEFLKDVKTIMRRCENVVVQKPVSDPEELQRNWNSFFKHHSILKKLILDFKESFLAELEWRKSCSFAVEVTLDPDTAHRWLILSEDEKSVRCGDKAQDVPKNPQRYDIYPIVLGRERLNSGRHYWEVEVTDKAAWELGVCDESVSRKGEVTAFEPDKGYWTVRLRHNKYQAMTSPPTLLTPQVLPRVVGIFLDYEAGRISFYNVEGRRLLYAFPQVAFPPQLRPLFNPGLRSEWTNDIVMQILPVTEQEWEEEDECTRL